MSNMKKLSFFPVYILNLFYTIAFSSIAFFAFMIIGPKIFLLPTGAATGTLIISNIFFFAFLLWRFVVVGYRDRKRNQVPFKEFLYSAVLASIIYGIFTFIYAYILKSTVLVNNVVSLAFIMCGKSSASTMRLEELPTGFLSAFSISLLLHIALLIVASYAFYRIGIARREFETSQIIENKQVTKKFVIFKTAFCFIPIMNYIIFFPWLYRYLVNPERKLRKLFLYLLAFSGIQIAFQFIRTQIYELNVENSINIIIYVVAMYLYGVIVSLMVVHDEKRWGKLCNQDHTI